MPTTAATYPGTVATVEQGFGDGWVNPNNVKIDDGSNATIETASFPVINAYLRCTNFSFEIPDNASITNVLLEWEATFSNVGLDAGWVAAQLVHEGEAIIDGTSLASGVDGGPFVRTDNGFDVSSLTPAIVNDSTFGVQIRPGGEATVDVDYVRLTITYALAGGGSGSARCNRLLKPRT